MPKSRARLSSGRAISSVVERFLHTEEATGSIPVSPTMLRASRASYSPYKTLVVLAG
jgi:hypothetical protein